MGKTPGHSDGPPPRRAPAHPLDATPAPTRPWCVGVAVSQGRLGLSPEDTARLPPAVPVGTRVRFVYQPVKAGTRDGDAFVEAHPDVYKTGQSLPTAARTALRQRGLEKTLDKTLLDAALQEQSGVPVPLASPALRTAAATAAGTRTIR